MNLREASAWTAISALVLIACTAASETTPSPDGGDGGSTTSSSTSSSGGSSSGGSSSGNSTSSSGGGDSGTNDSGDAGSDGGNDGGPPPPGPPGSGCAPGSLGVAPLFDHRTSASFRDGNRLLTSYGTSGWRLLDLDTRGVVAEGTGEAIARGGVILEASSRLANATVTARSMATGAALGTFGTGVFEGGTATALRLAVDGSYAWATRDDATAGAEILAVWSTATGARLFTITNTGAYDNWSQSRTNGSIFAAPGELRRLKGNAVERIALPGGQRTVTANAYVGAELGWFEDGAGWVTIASPNVLAYRNDGVYLGAMPAVSGLTPGFAGGFGDAAWVATPSGGTGKKVDIYRLAPGVAPALEVTTNATDARFQKDRSLIWASNEIFDLAATPVARTAVNGTASYAHLSSDTSGHWSIVDTARAVYVQSAGGFERVGCGTAKSFAATTAGQLYVASTTGDILTIDTTTSAVSAKTGSYFTADVTADGATLIAVSRTAVSATHFDWTIERVALPAWTVQQTVTVANKRELFASIARGGQLWGSATESAFQVFDAAGAQVATGARAVNPDNTSHTDLIALAFAPSAPRFILGLPGYPKLSVLYDNGVSKKTVNGGPLVWLDDDYFMTDYEQSVTTRGPIVYDKTGTYNAAPPLKAGTSITMYLFPQTVTQGYLTSRPSSPTISRVSTFTGQAIWTDARSVASGLRFPLAGLTATHAAWVTGDGIVATHPH